MKNSEEQISVPNIAKRSIIVLLAFPAVILIAILTDVWTLLSPVLLGILKCDLALKIIVFLILCILYLWYEIIFQRRAVRRLKNLWNGQLHVFSARYGCANKWIDVTEAVKSHLNNNSLILESSNNLGGDPFPGKAKELVIYYWHDGSQKEHRFLEGSNAVLPMIKA